MSAPFATHKGSLGGSEVNCQPCGAGLQRAIGELVTCPFCMAQWTAAFFTDGLILSSRPTRLVAAASRMVALADVLNIADEAVAARLRQLRG